MLSEIYNEANNRQRLLGIAFVIHEKVTEAMPELEAPSCQNRSSLFNTVTESTTWLKGLHATTTQFNITHAGPSHSALPDVQRLVRYRIAMYNDRISH